MKNYLDRIEKNLAYEPNTGCWLWTAGINDDGYARMLFNGKARYVHRIVYEFRRGKIPVGLFALHSCDTPSCVNPDHIFLGTQTDNMIDKTRKGRAYRGVNHYRAKLDEYQIKAIRSIGKSLTIAQMAKYFKIDYCAIRNILMNKTWKHIK